MGCGASEPAQHSNAPAPTQPSTPKPQESPQAEAPVQPPAPAPAPPSVEASPPPPEPKLEEKPATTGERKLTLLHFNDVYNIYAGDRDPVGGAARFAHKAKTFAAEKPLIVFSGDAYNPSLMSTITLGKQMVPVLNAIGVHVSCMGNHDFDHGVANLQVLNAQCKFPWLMANVLDKETGKPFAGALETVKMDWNGVKVGFVGLVEREWLDTLSAVDPSTVTYVDFVELGRKLATQLRSEGCELIVAVTHMRVPNDRLLAESVAEIDIVMGGHDHHYETDHIQPHNNLMVKSGTDFRDLTRVEVVMPAPGSTARPTMTWERYPITSDIPEDPEVKAIVDEYGQLMGAAMESPMCVTRIDLDGRFQTVRTRESNLGNFVTDIMRHAMRADVVILNSGSLRSDVIHPEGIIKLKDMLSILPMLDCSVLLEATGQQLVQALENGVSMYPKLEGRFPQVSGVKFKFDPSQPPGSRVVPGSVFITSRGPEPVAVTPEGKYTISTKAYLATGKDGYDVFVKCKMLVDDEDGIAIPTAIRNHCRTLDVLNKLDPKAKASGFAKRWTSRLAAKSSGDLCKTNSQEQQQEAPASPDAPTSPDAGAASTAEGDKGAEDPALAAAEAAAETGAAATNQLPGGKMVVGDTGVCVLDGQYCIKPVVEGRIVNIAEESA